MKRRAFTLIELLVVISIIGLLSSVAAVQMSKSRDKARFAAGQSFDASLRRSIADQMEGEWLFEEASATTATDTSGFGRNGTVSGATPITGYNGGSAYSFGPANYIDIPYGWAATGKSFAVTAWVYDAGSGTGEVIFDASGGRVSMEIRNSNLGCLTNNDAWRSGASNALPKNTWVHVACVFDSASGTLNGYMNGTLMFSLADNAPAADPTQMRINGNTIGGFRLTGYIDDVRLYSASLSAAAMRKLYAEGEDLHRNLASAH